MHSFVRHSITKWLVEVDDNSVHKFSVVSEAAHDASTAHAHKREAFLNVYSYLPYLYQSTLTHACLQRGFLHMELTRTS